MTDPQELYKINRQEKTPLYDLIEQNLRELILRGQLNIGDAVPSEWALADLYGVSRLTVRTALDNLTRQGWLIRRHGVGTFVAHPNITEISPSKLSFTDQMRAIGRKPSSRLVSLQVVVADAEVANMLRLEQDKAVVEIVRVRLADGEPVLLETSYLSQKRFSGLEHATALTHSSLYEWLGTHYQTNVTVMDQILEPVLLNNEQARYLETLPGTPAMLSKVIAYNNTAEPIEYSWSVARGDKCRFYFSFRRGEECS
jgi:GntR family transcriptional regulator, N-acetylglucosamine utilization regulator